MSFGADEDLMFAEDHIANLEAAIRKIVDHWDDDHLGDAVHEAEVLTLGGYCRLSCHHAKYDPDDDDCGCPCHEEER